MTNRNLNSKINRGNTEGANPFLLKPAGKDYLWGGTRLRDDFSKCTDLVSLAETWECSTHPDGASTVSGGEFHGMTLTEVLLNHPEFLGTHPGSGGKLPILVKFIDANKDLSVQVHPDDEYAVKYENGSLGKTEMWYVLEASDDAKLIYGFNHDMDKETLRKSIEEGTIEKYLQKLPVKKGDVFYIEAGKVHAVGAGLLLVEIQESSNLTYRMFDYNRCDKNGKKRELHIDKALEVADLRGYSQPRQPMRVLRYQRGYATELLCRCKYFYVERMLINTEQRRDTSAFCTGLNSFLALLCIEGCGVLYGERGIRLDFYKGDCIFVPAGSVPLRIHGKAQLLKVSC